MINKDFDGQMDFLGLISEYTDDQGATVRVREPGVRRSKPIAPPEPEQLTMELTVEEGPSSVTCDDTFCPHPSPTVTPSPTCGGRPEKENSLEKEGPHPSPTVTPSPTCGGRPEKENSLEKEDPHPSLAGQVTPVSSPTRSVPNTVHRTVAPPQVEGRLKKKSLKTSTEGVKLFPECGKCWCRDCKHNSRNEGIPKEIGTIHMACPACSACEEEGHADICEIGNAIEGCRTRAIEEGILIPEGEVQG